MDVRLALSTGVDIPVPSCQLSIHQPSINEISMMGEIEFFTGAQCLCVEKNKYIKDENLLSDVTNFQIFMTIMSERQEIEKKNNTLAVLNLLFPDYKILFTPSAVVLNKDGENFVIDENNFEELQKIFQQIFCLKGGEKDGFNPGNEAAKKIADKLMRARQRVAQQKTTEEGDGSMLRQYASSLSIGLHIPLQYINQYTLCQLYESMERFSLWINWDLDIRSRLAGGQPDSKPDNWMKNIH